MYYPTVPNGLWPTPYQFGTAQQQAMPAVYYQVPTNQIPEMVVQQPVPTVYYSAPTITAPPITTATTSEGVVQQTQGNTTTTTKTITTRILDPAPQTVTTTTAAVTVPPVTTTTTTVVPPPPVETTTIQERSRYPTRGLRSLSTITSTSYDDTTTSTDSTITPEPIKTNAIIPPAFPIHTTAMAPVHRVIHRPYTPSGYYSEELDYGRRKVYKTDYKYRHYYCCNICKGRFDLHNRSYGCCEWFYGCPIWALILSGLLFLALLVTFFTLLGLQPSLNSSRFASTAQTRLLNRTQVVYGFYQNCGFQVNATSGTATTLILCTNTATTTTARIQLSPFYTVISKATDYSSSRILILLCSLSVLQISMN